MADYGCRAKSLCAVGDVNRSALSPPVLGEGRDVQPRQRSPMSAVSLPAVSRLSGSGSGVINSDASVSDLLS